MNDIDNVISRLEKQRSAIDRALLALREISGSNTPNAQPVGQSERLIVVPNPIPPQPVRPACRGVLPIPALATG